MAMRRRDEALLRGFLWLSCSRPVFLLHCNVLQSLELCKTSLFCALLSCSFYEGAFFFRFHPVRLEFLVPPHAACLRLLLLASTMVGYYRPLGRLGEWVMRAKAL
jgi:hypothetical protein